MSHRLVHPEYVVDCFACKANSISMAAAATPTRRREVVAVNQADKMLGADRDAYKRLRRDGLQPKHLDGSAELEKRVGSQFEIDLGRHVPAAEVSRVQEGFAMAADMGLGKS